jgi:methionyl aminopeptidase
MRHTSKKNLKTPEQIAQIRQAGLLTWQAHQVVARMVRPGVTTGEINAAVEEFIDAHHAIPLFKGVPGVVPFPAAACISTNEEVVHGIPGSRRLCAGDVVSVDIGIRLNGWCGDAAVTHPVGDIDPVAQSLLDITEGTLQLAIHLLGKRRLWSQIAKEMQAYVEAAGFSVVQELVGHGIGRQLWESPSVPNYYSRSFERNEDFVIEPGLVLAIEPMVNVGTRRLKTLADHWTITTEDGLPSAHFEHTIAITKQGPILLTAGPNGEGWATG